MTAVPAAAAAARRTVTSATAMAVNAEKCGDEVVREGTVAPTAAIPEDPIVIEDDCVAPFEELPSKILT